jgi:hypothetical protein
VILGAGVGFSLVTARIAAALGRRKGSN